MVHCRVRPRHPLHNRLVCLPSSGIRRNQDDAAGTLACARRHNDVTRCNGIDMPPYGPLCANMTSFIKPEVGYITYRNAARRGPSHGHGGRMHKNFVKNGLWYRRYACRQTDTLITILCCPTGGGVTEKKQLLQADRLSAAAARRKRRQ